ncbi:MAG: Arm DNA-binding domain-containing protein [Bacteroidota bacterium]
MSTATIKFVIRSSKKRKDGTTPIMLRISADGRTTEVSTGIAVPPALWSIKRQRQDLRTAS